MSRILTILNRAEAFLIIALFTVTPMLVTPSTYELFEFPKMMFVYAVTIILVAVGLSKIVLKSVFPSLSSLLPCLPAGRSSVFCHHTSKQVLTLSFVAFVMTNIISTLFSPYLHTSLWGYYSRFSGGLVSVICFVAIFLVLSNLTKEKLMLILKTTILTAAVISIYGIAQHFGLEKDRWVQDVTARVFASFGQPNWLAAFLIMIIPININFLLDSPNYLERGLFLTAGSLLFAALWFTFSLSGLLALAVMMIIFLSVMNKQLLLKNARWLMSLFAIWVLVALWQPGLAKARFEDTLKTVNDQLSIIKPALASSGSYQVGDTSNIRLIVWSGVLKSVLSNPKALIIGNGPETVAFTFPPFRPLEMNQTSEQSFLYNKAHNYFLDLFSNLGLIGLISYLLLNVAAIVIAIKNRHNTLKLAIGTALVGNLITNFFGWPTVTTNLIFALYLSFLTI